MSVQDTAATAAVDTSLALWTAGGNLPAFLEVDGRALVLLDAADYRELVAARSALVRQALSGSGTKAGKPQRLGLSTIERDAEVADWLRDNFKGGVSIEGLRRACKERFGEERTPSTNRVQKFRQRTIGKVGGLTDTS